MVPIAQDSDPHDEPSQARGWANLDVSLLHRQAVAIVYAAGVRLSASGGPLTGGAYPGVVSERPSDQFADLVV